MATKNIHIHLPALLKKPVKARDASPASIEKEIANQQRLIAIMEKGGKDAGSLKQRLKFLQEELEKAKVKEGTKDATNFPSSIRYKGAVYYKTGKTGKSFKTGKETAEYENYDKPGERVWYEAETKKITEDSVSGDINDADPQSDMSQRRQRLIAALRKHGFEETARTVENKKYMSIPDMAKLERGLVEKGYSLDAGFTTYDPREAKRLDDEIKEVEAKIKVTKSPFGKKDLEQVLEKLKKERAKYRS